MTSQPSESNFTVAIRIKNTPSQQKNIYKVPSSNQLVMNSQHGSIRERRFAFPHIYPSISNTLLFDQLIKEKLALLRQNYNLMIMAYGVTGSGKTYTVFGNEQGRVPGVGILAFEQVMAMPKYTFHFSYLQVYNQQVNDLLTESVGQGNKLKALNVLEDEEGKVQIPDLKKVKVSSFDELKGFIEMGNEARSCSETNMNKVSSRSHAIMQLECRNCLTFASSTLTVIDLAGSEKSSHSSGSQLNKNILQKEGSNINRSLLTLGNCIQSLEKGQKHIPYRDSKLTRIIKEQLSGNSFNVMIGCINPIPSQFQQTINTLNYASRASNIKVEVQKNQNRSNFFQCKNCHTVNQIPITVSSNITPITLEKIQQAVNKLKQQIFQQLAESQVEQSCLFTENDDSSAFVEKVSEIINKHEIQILATMKKCIKSPQPPLKAQKQLTLDVSFQSLSTEKSTFEKNIKINEGNLKKKISLRNNFQFQNTRRRVNSQHNFNKTQRMNRDIDEDQQYTTNKQTIMRKIENAQRKIENIQVSSFDLGF